MRTYKIKLSGNQKKSLKLLRAVKKSVKLFDKKMSKLGFGKGDIAEFLTSVVGDIMLPPNYCPPEGEVIEPEQDELVAVNSTVESEY